MQNSLIRYLKTITLIKKNTLNILWKNTLKGEKDKNNNYNVIAIIYYKTNIYKK